jgi:hypothetical protein
MSITVASMLHNAKSNVGPNLALAIPQVMTTIASFG